MQSQKPVKELPPCYGDPAVEGNVFDLECGECVVRGMCVRRAREL